MSAGFSIEQFIRTIETFSLIEVPIERLTINSQALK